MNLPKTLGTLKTCISLYNQTLKKAADASDILLSKITELESNLSIVANIIQNDDEKLEASCQICCSRPKTHAVIPCGHVICVSCAGRAESRRRCFTCRSEITRIQRVFF